MLNSAQYDVIEAIFPIAGMNQNLSPDVLKQTHTYWLENILAMPLGQGRVRYGSIELPNITLPVDSEIQEIIYFFNSNTKKDQFLFYVQEYSQDITGLDMSFVDSKITFKSSKLDQYFNGTTLKVVYTKNAVQNIAYLDVSNKLVNTATNSIEFSFAGDASVYNGVTINQIYYPKAKLYLYTLQGNQFTATPLKDNLAAHSIPRYIFFQNKILICNGVDKLMSWDGQTLQEVYDFVAEHTHGLTRVADTRFHVTIANDVVFDETKYFHGQQIQLKISNNFFNLTIAQASLTPARDQLIIDTIATLPDEFIAGALQTNILLFYKDYPPAFSYLHVHKDRIYALAEGPTDNTYRNQPLYVYFTYRELSVNDWFDETTKQTPYIDLSYTHGEYDQIEAIESINDQLVFMGRKKTQMWYGVYPLDKDKFYWKSTINTGIVHGNLLTLLGKQIVFVSQNGIMSLGAQDGISSSDESVIVSSQANVASLPQLDPLVQRYNKDLSNQKQYRACRAFRYEDGPFIGFKIGFNNTLIGLTKDGVQSWSVFTGIFKHADAFCAIHQKLFIAKNDKLFYYADGQAQDVEQYSDAGEAIPFSWTLPMIQNATKRFSCKRYEVKMNYPLLTQTANNNVFKLKVYGDLNQSFEVELIYPGDFIDTKNPPLPPYYEGAPDINRPYAPFNARLSFVSRSFWASLSGIVRQGPVVIKSVKFLGRRER